MDIVTIFHLGPYEFWCILFAAYWTFEIGQGTLMHLIDYGLHHFREFMFACLTIYFGMQHFVLIYCKLVDARLIPNTPRTGDAAVHWELLLFTWGCIFVFTAFAWTPAYTLRHVREQRSRKRHMQSRSLAG